MLTHQKPLSEVGLAKCDVYKISRWSQNAAGGHNRSETKHGMGSPAIEKKKEPTVPLPIFPLHNP